MPLSLCLTAILCCAIAVTGDAVAGESPLRSGDFELRLGGFAFDPLAGEPQLPSGWEMKASGAADLHMVQFDGPIPAGTFAMLREAGVEPVQYIHPNTYIVWGRRGQRTALEGKESVRWTGDFVPAYRVQPRWRNLEAETVDVKVLIYRGADADAVIEAIGSLGGEQTGRLVVNEKFEVAGFKLPGDLMKTAASVPGVYTVQVQATDGGSRGEVSDQINAGNLFSGFAIPGYGSWLDGLGLDGSGVTVAVVDEGVDWTHPDLLAHLEPCTGGSCSSSSSIHGTHTAGIIAGDGSSYVLDGYNFLRGLGVAPGAGLVDQRFYPAMEQPGGVLALMTDSQRNGASLSNNSWGTSVVAAGYDVDAMLVDAGVRDADPERPGNQPLLYVLAINNGQGGTSTQGSPDEAKNTITVGASRALAADGTQDPAIDSLASVSAHGPALDGRTIPHIVAPGCLVDSTYPDAGQGPQHYTRCGTSQAAPQISGAAALFIEHYRSLPGTTTDPSPALIKAAILPVAHDLDGNLDADGVAMGHRPDSKQGWGRLNLSAVVDPPAGSVLYFDQARVFEVSGEEWIRVVTPLDPAEPMKIMLTWTDAPGHGLGGTTPALSNDLDLVVELDGNTYHGNYFGLDGFSATGGSADTLDNTEGVFLQNPAGNDVTVRVQATNVNSDGVPGYNDDTDQDFALVCYNCDLVPGFALAGHPVTRNTCSPDLSSWAIDVEQLSGYGNDVALTISGVPAGAIAGFDTDPVTPGGSSHLTLDPGTAVTANYAMLVTGDTVDMSRSIPVYLYLRTAAPDPAVLTLPADAAADIHPQPVLEWDPVTWTDHYLVEIAADAAFTDIIYTALEEGTSHAVLNTLEELDTYYWRVRATNACGYGIFSPVRSFTTLDTPDILLVDDDWDLPNVQNDFTKAFTQLGLALGVDYDIWDVWVDHARKQPDARTLATYDKVIWFTGEEEIYAGPSSPTEDVLADWLDRVGCFLISSQDYLLVRGHTDFIKERLGVSAYVEDAGQDTVWAMGSVYGPLWEVGGWGLKAATDYSDTLTPDATAELAFDGDLGPAAVNKDGGFYRTTFTGFGMERFPGLTQSPEMQGTLQAFLDWCDGLPALDGDSDGVLNGDDCVAGDPDVWGVPEPVTDLTLGRGEYGFFWSQPVGGGGAEYDVLRSYDYSDWYNASCVAAGTSGLQAWNDDVEPLPGEVIFYQVRARNECGLSTLGNNFDGSVRYGTACE